MRRWWMLFALAACEPATATPRDAAPAPAPAPAAVVPVDAAPPHLYQREDGFDFRAVALDPSTVGSEQLCVVGYLADGHVSCVADRAYENVEIATDDYTPKPDDVLRVRVIDGGHATLVEKAGMLRPPPRPDRCGCIEHDRTPKPTPPRTDDFARVWKEDPRNTMRNCDVISVQEIMRSAPDAPAFSPGTYFDPSVAPFAARLYCRAGEKDSSLVLGTSDYRNLLSLEQGDVIAVRLTWTKHDEATALYVHTVKRRYE